MTGFDERMPSIKAKASINGKPVTVMFDTGALSILSVDAARRVGLLDDKKQMVPAGTVFGAGSGERPSWTVPVQTFELGTERITNSRLRVVDMLIGIDFFLSHRIYVAPSQDRMFFTYTGGPVFDLSTKTATPVQADAALADAPQDAAAFSRRGTAFAARGEPAQALKDLDRAVELAPTVAAYRTQRAHVKLQLRQRDDAMADLDEALRLDPNADEARLDRAWLRKADAGSRDEVRRPAVAGPAGGAAVRPAPQHGRAVPGNRRAAAGGEAVRPVGGGPSQGGRLVQGAQFTLLGAGLGQR